MILKSSYKRPSILVNGHIETIYPALFRKVHGIKPVPERINTPDKDFLDLDWYLNGSNSVAVVCHGLEGNSRKPYVLGMTKALLSTFKIDVLAWNYRGCSGEMNRTNRFYHSGATDDLEFIINYALQKYDQLTLIGFSLGGNLVLKYLGERGPNLDDRVRAAVTFSVPLDLEASSIKMKNLENYIYTQRFLKTLKKKVNSKESLKSEHLAFDELKNIKDLFHFDDLFTGPLHGFKDAHDYYQTCSSLYFLKAIERPVLIVNAKNDPFLADSCFPYDMLQDHKYVQFESPEHGGHCGFAEFRNGFYWSEKRALDFLKPLIGNSV